MKTVLLGNVLGPSPGKTGAVWQEPCLGSTGLVKIGLVWGQLTKEISKRSCMIRAGSGTIGMTLVGEVLKSSLCEARSVVLELGLEV